MQSCQSLRGEFNFLPFGSSLEQCNFESESDFREVFDEGSYYPATLNQELDAIKELVVDTDSSVLPQLVPKCHKWKNKPSSIFHKLKDLYHEEIQLNNISDIPEIRQSSYLLDKLVQRDRYNMIILTLFPIVDGYSIGISNEEGEIFHEHEHPYTKDVLLDYVDKEQLPTPYIDYWEQHFPQLFYDGCVIAQVRDLRHGLPAHIHHVLLKPHTQSLISDVNKLLMDGNQSWSPEEQFSVECNVINNAQRSLCLDPSPEAGKRMLKLHQDLHAFDTNSIRNLIFRNSQLVQHRKRKYEHLLPRSNLFLNDYIANKIAAPSNNRNTNIVPNLEVPDSEAKILQNKYQIFPTPEVIREVERNAKLFELPMTHLRSESSLGPRCFKLPPNSDDYTPQVRNETSLNTSVFKLTPNDFTPQVIEECLMETKDTPKGNITHNNPTASEP